MSGAFDIAFWHWWVAGLLLLALEAFAPGAVFLWMGVAALVTGGVWVAQGFVAARLAPGIMDPQGFGELLTPIFSVLIVFVLAEVFREGARLRRESELTI